jgi:DNA-binding LacI/PurR family transcriptional regulator
MSIIDVANLAGVSKSTVSRVINHSAKVAPDVVRAVESAMRQINYAPPLRRRGPKPMSRRGIHSGNIALLLMGVNASDLYRLPVFPHLLHGVERGLAEKGLNLILANLGKGEELPAVLSSGRADGLLLWGKWDAMPDPVREKLRQIPTVWIVREHSDSQGEFDHVFYDNLAVGRLAARHLGRRGHRSMAFINALPHHSAFIERGREFIAAAEDAGLQAHSFVREVDGHNSDYSISQDLVDRMLRIQPRPTGLFVPTDTQLAGVYHALEERGMRPMEDVEIISCDNERQFLSRLTPRPVTININLELVGRRGVSQLLWRMRHPELKNRISVLVEPTLVVPSGPGTPQTEGRSFPGYALSGNGESAD